MIKNNLKIKRVNNIFIVDAKLTEHLKNTWEIVPDSWKSSKCYWWIVKDAKTGEIAGFSAMRIHDHLTFYVGPVEIFSKYRGQGLQLKLLKKKIAFAKKKVYTSIVSSTEAWNYWSSNNLIKAGFRLRAEWEGMKDERNLYWEKKL